MGFFEFFFGCPRREGGDGVRVRTGNPRTGHGGRSVRGEEGRDAVESPSWFVTGPVRSRVVKGSTRG